MFEFIGGVAVGAAFSPFWIKVWEVIKVKATELINKK